MTGLIRVSAYPAVEALGWALLHSVWQGTLVAALLAVMLRLLDRKSAQLRYVIACCALILVFILPALTWRQLLFGSTAEVTKTNGQIESSFGVAARMASPFLGGEAGSILNAVAQSLNRCLPWLLLLWSTGVMLFSSRLCMGIVDVRRLKSRATEPMPSKVQDLFDSARRGLGIHRMVKISASKMVEVPTVVGCLRPVILYPIACLAGLSPTQVEALLVHELAHVRRQDFVVNVLQSVMEALLFYHPAVWWISAQIREEREHCCDDLAGRVSGNPLAYAKALLFLEEYRSAMPIGALGANGGKLAYRIRRLLGSADTHPVAPFSATALVILAVIAATLTCAATGSAPTFVRVGAQSAALEYQHLSAQDIEQLQHYGITSSFAQAINAAGLGRASVEQLVRLRQYGVDPQYAVTIKKLGLADLTLEDLVRFRQYDVSLEYAARMYAAGYRQPGQILRLQQQGISVAQVDNLQSVISRSSSEKR